MARARIEYLSSRESDFIHEKTLEVLARAGVAYNSHKALDVLEAAGVEVDREHLSARLEWDVIEAALRTAPRKVLLAGRLPEHDHVLGDGRLVTTSDGMTTYVLDEPGGTRREGTAADLATVTRLCDALDEIDVVWPSPQAGDVDAWMMPLVMQATMIRNTAKHVQDEVRTPEMVEPILALYEAAAGAPLRERPIFSVTNCTIAPLQHDREMTEAGLELAARGVPIFVLPMPQAGTTGPMTLLGTCIVHLAELLSAVVLYQLAVPGCPLIAGVGAAVADMRSGGYVSAAPEIGLINLICLEMSRRYGLPTQATGISPDAWTSDFQAGSEGGMTGLVAALAGADSLIAAGSLGGVQCSSLAKLVLDNDQLGAIRRYLREDPIDETAALMEDILEVGVGGHYLGRRSTRHLARTETWRPQLFRREDYGAPGARTLVQAAAERAEELLASHDVPPLAAGVDRAHRGGAGRLGGAAALTAAPRPGARPRRQPTWSSACPAAAATRRSKEASRPLAARGSVTRSTSAPRDVASTASSRSPAGGGGSGRRPSAAGMQTLVSPRAASASRPPTARHARAAASRSTSSTDRQAVSCGRPAATTSTAAEYCRSPASMRARRAKTPAFCSATAARPARARARRSS